jgi:hypothetical protein
LPHRPQDVAKRAEPLLADRGRLLRLGAALLLVSSLAALAPAVGRDMAALYERIDASSPYFSAADPLLLYVRLPLAVLGASVLVLSRRACWSRWRSTWGPACRAGSCSGSRRA